MNYLGSLACMCLIFLHAYVHTGDFVFESHLRDFCSWLVLGLEHPVSGTGSPQDESHIHISFTPVQNTVTYSKFCLTHCCSSKNSPLICLSVHSNTYFGMPETNTHSIPWCYLYSIGTHHGNLFKLLVIISRVTHFIWCIFDMYLWWSLCTALARWELP